MVRIASYNVENLFARPKVFRTNDWSTSEPILAAYEEVNALFRRTPTPIRTRRTSNACWSNSTSMS